MRKKRLVILISMVIVFVLPSFLVNAATNDRSTKNDALQTDGKIAAKDEVVYATLSATGDTKDIYVVNILDVSKAGTIIDYGAYSSIKNLTDLSVVTQQGNNTIRLDAPTGKFYYQGSMSNRELPWDIRLTYSLDGKEIAPEDLAGKNGRLQIKIITSANEKVNTLFYENFLLQISLALDSHIYSDIQAPEAMIANVGKNKQVTFTVMPEQDGNLSIEADVVDFEMEGIEIAAVPSSMSIDVPNIGGVTDDMQTLTDAIQQVNNGVLEFKTGVSELNNGVNSLSSGSAKYQRGMIGISEASSELIDASTIINQSLAAISNSVSGNSGEMDLTELKELPDGLSQLADGLSETADGLSFLRENYSVAYSTLDGAMQAIPEHAITEQEIHELYMSGADSDVVDKLVDTYSAARTAKGTYTAVKEGFDAVDTTLHEVSGSVREMGNILASMSYELSLSLESMDGTDSFAQLEEGLAQLSSNYGQFHSGLISYTNGVSQLSDSYKELHSGIVELSGGTDGLETGAGELQNGTSKLYESTSDLPEQMQGEIDKMLAQYDKSNYEPVSFVSSKNSNINSVQFAIKTESITKEVVETIFEEEEEVKGFWSRLKNLFF